MDLTVSFVWIGRGGFGWLEKFMVYSWWAVGCNVNLYTHNPFGEPHNHESLGLPSSIGTVHDLPTIMREDAEKTLGEQTRRVLASWYAQPLPMGKDEWRVPTFNMVDLSKSYIGMHKVGIVFDMKVGPSAHIQRYVESGVFHNHFVSYKRAKVVENQCMGSMMPVASDNARVKYGRGFEQALFTKGGQHGELEPVSMRTSMSSMWFPIATDAHKKALGSKGAITTGSMLGLRGEWFDIGPYGKARHEHEGIREATFEGIDGGYYGPIRIFKNEWDQTNKSSNQAPTTPEQRKLEVERALKKLLPAAKKSGRHSELVSFLMSPAMSNALGLKRF